MPGSQLLLTKFPCAHKILLVLLVILGHIVFPYTVDTAGLDGHCKLSTCRMLQVEREGGTMIKCQKVGFVRSSTLVTATLEGGPERAQLFKE